MKRVVIRREIAIPVSEVWVMQALLYATDVAKYETYRYPRIGGCTWMS